MDLEGEQIHILNKAALKALPKLEDSKNLTGNNHRVTGDARRSGNTEQ